MYHEISLYELWNQQDSFLNVLILYSTKHTDYTYVLTDSY